jgi:hypothetical protein
VFASDAVYKGILERNGVDTSKGIAISGSSAFLGRMVLVHLLTEQEKADALARNQSGGYFVIYYVSILGYCVIERYC